MGDTTGLFFNDTFLTLNGPTYQLDDFIQRSHVRVYIWQTGFQTRIKTYFANSSLIVDSLPNMPTTMGTDSVSNEGCQVYFSLQNNSTLSISTKYSLVTQGKVSNTILGYTYRDKRIIQTNFKLSSSMKHLTNWSPYGPKRYCEDQLQV